MEELKRSHISMLKEMQIREQEQKELEEFENLREEIKKGDLDIEKMERALKLAYKYFGL